MTPIHDHSTWCSFGVVQGAELEERFDIHRVRNVGDHTAISIHVYGTDVSRVGSSVRRVYELPVA